MVDRSMLLTLLFQESYTKTKEAADLVSHEESVRPFNADGLSMHWMVGHIVVSRCNFMMLLEVPSIWDWATCKLFIPGSNPGPESDNQLDFAALLADLDRTQEPLLTALSQCSDSELNVVKGDKSIAEEFASYAAHESFHAGQLELFRQWLKK